MKLATNPRRSRASISIAPTSAVSAASPRQLRHIAVADHQASCVLVRIAKVAVELTLSTRDEPSSA
jgi:hypothetical protein